MRRTRIVVTPRVRTALTWDTFPDAKCFAESASYSVQEVWHVRAVIVEQEILKHQNAKIYEVLIVSVTSDMRRISAGNVHIHKNAIKMRLRPI
jgi:predicted Rdx family selenoprotein